MNYFLDRFLKNSGRRLNQIVMAIHLVKIMGWVGAGGAVLVLAVRVLGWNGSAMNIWLALTGAGGLVGLGMGWRHRLDKEAVARWLDEYQNNAEAYSAALVCLGRNCSEPLDDLVVERAEAMAVQPISIRWPIRHLIRKTVIASGLLLGALAIVLWNPQPAWNISQSIISKQKVEKVSRKFRPDMNQPEQRQLARELALQVFPRNARRAREFQRALESGDKHQLEALIKQARLGFEERMAQGASLSEQERFLDEQQLIQKLRPFLDKVKSGNRSQLGRKESDDTGGDETSLPAQRGDLNPAQAKPDSVTNQPKRLTGSSQSQYRSFYRLVWKNRNSGGKAESTKTGIPYQRGAEAGLEPGHKKGDWSITAKPGPQKPVTGQKHESPAVEFILPGQKAAVPLARVLPDFRRAAEAALTRNGVPGEYDDFVRAYFLELSREIKGNSPESEGQK
jgi:hypothetical protein